jgi:hypothetical protein
LLLLRTGKIGGLNFQELLDLWEETCKWRQRYINVTDFIKERRRKTDIYFQGLQCKFEAHDVNMAKFTSPPHQYISGGKYHVDRMGEDKLWITDGNYKYAGRSMQRKGRVDRRFTDFKFLNI